MEFYLVGGAIRDELLGLPISERDWCVVGATPDDMLNLGYTPVGRDFPVFLHPETKEEYALARTERKTAAGYHGFAFHADPSVSIEQDLMRRDLTINAMARSDDGSLIDPHGGRRDIDARVLRHVSDAFVEDPVRVLRVAKFNARLHSCGFRVAEETAGLMRSMVDNGEVESLVADRTWKETQAALTGPEPQVYFETLRECGALAVIFPELDSLYGVPQPPQWHPEIDCGIHTMMVLKQASLLSDDPAVRFAALVHDLGKATSDPRFLPKHHGHEARSVKLVQTLSKRLPVPSAWRELALLVAEFHGHCHRAFELRPETVLKMLNRTDAFRRTERFENFVTACKADFRGRTGYEDCDYPQARYLRAAHSAAIQQTAQPFVSQGLEGMMIRRALDAARVQSIRACKEEWLEQDINNNAGENQPVNNKRQ